MEEVGTVPEKQPSDEFKIKHTELGIDFQAIPFIWHYNDFANPYPTYESKKMSADDVRKLEEKYKINLSCIPEPEYYCHKQYRAEDFLYNSKSQEVYLGFHTWLLRQIEGPEFKIGDNDIYYKFKFRCQLIPLQGTIRQHKNFPEKFIQVKVSKKAKKIISVINGINVSNAISQLNFNKLSKRNAIIHKHQGFTRFSPYQICNFVIPSNNSTDIVSFISIITDVFAYKIKLKKKIDNEQNNLSNDGKEGEGEEGEEGREGREEEEEEEYEEIEEIKINKSCITCHIFRHTYGSEKLEELETFNL